MPLSETDASPNDGVISFEGFVGNEKIVLTLRQTLEAHRVAPSLLFTGRPGVGKKTLALRLAQALNCLDRKKIPCGRCSSCVKIQARTHPDVVLVEILEDKTRLLIEQIREMRDETYYRPFEGRARVFIVDDADEMTEAAANSILKTLEEPPPTTHLILLTANFHSLLPTIRSRCQIFSFVPIAVESIRKYLAKHSALSSTDQELAARLSQGSMGRALSLDLSSFRARRAEVLEFVSIARAGAPARSLMALAETIGKDKENFEERLSILYLLLHDLFYLALHSPESWIANVDLAPELQSFAEQATISWIQSAIAKLDEMRAGLRFNINRPLALESFAYRLASR